METLHSVQGDIKCFVLEVRYSPRSRQNEAFARLWLEYFIHIDEKNLNAGPKESPSANRFFDDDDQQH